MVSYTCLECKKEFKVREKVQCPYCGYRIVKKSRPSMTKRIRAE